VVPESVIAATAGLEPPYAVLDLEAFRRNAADLAARANDVPIRVATKSVRCRHLLRMVVALPGYGGGLLASSLAEALWLAGAQGRDTEADADPVSRDIVVGYPSVDRSSLAALAADEVARTRLTLMIDDPAQLALLRQALDQAGPCETPVRVCLDVDASYRLGPAHLGARRSPIRTPEQAAELTDHVVADPRLLLDGVMFYDAQIAGIPDRPAGAAWAAPAVRLLKRTSALELASRRTAVIAAVSERLRHAGRPRLRFVNGGGTGSLEVVRRDAVLTELAAGSGLLAPTLFDGYRAFTPAPAAYFVLPVLRRPAPDLVTCAAGGFVASGPAGSDRLPTPVHPPGLALTAAEGAGEVQTPLRVQRGGRGASGEEALPTIGSAVWFRHAKAGELLEHFDALHLVRRGVRGGTLVDTVPTYRGELRSYG
jgi:D-serine deaminase-like pyridoxal phosphate-dependent protein